MSSIVDPYLLQYKFKHTLSCYASEATNWFQYIITLSIEKLELLSFNLTWIGEVRFCHIELNGNSNKHLVVNRGGIILGSTILLLLSFKLRYFDNMLLMYYTYDLFIY